jgi:hypothetical protein
MPLANSDVPAPTEKRWGWGWRNDEFSTENPSLCELK